MNERLLRENLARQVRRLLARYPKTGLGVDVFDTIGFWCLPVGSRVGQYATRTAASRTASFEGDAVVNRMPLAMAAAAAVLILRKRRG